MPRFTLPNSATIHTARAFLEASRPFERDSDTAVLEFHPTWGYLEPFALAMVAAWGAWCRRHGMRVVAENVGRHAVYAARMRLFEHLGAEFPSGVPIDEEERFLPVTQVRSGKELRGILRDLPFLLGLRDDGEGLAAVRYCVSELVRNALEHSASPDGAFVCVKRYTDAPPHRVTVAVADCGMGISRNEGVEQAMTTSGRDGGFGLSIARTIAKGTGGYFFLASGHSAYRLRRTLDDENQLPLLPDQPDEDRTDRWDLPVPWQGTVASLEVRTERIGDYRGDFFPWVFRQVGGTASREERIRFT